MATSRVLGLILTAAGVILGVAIVAWLVSGMQHGELNSSGAIFGAVLSFGALVIPLVGGGIFLLVRGAAEQKLLVAAQQQRKLLDIVSTRGSVSIPDLVLEMDTSRDNVQQDLYGLVGRGLFTGYVDWNRGMLYSVEASQLQGRQTCPNCGGKLELAGKGLVKCPFCGAEIFLQG